MMLANQIGTSVYIVKAIVARLVNFGCYRSYNVSCLCALVDLLSCRQLSAVGRVAQRATLDSYDYPCREDSPQWMRRRLFVYELSF